MVGIVGPYGGGGEGGGGVVDKMIIMLLSYCMKIELEVGLCFG
jgi:hypothetical protein